jgi:hypothetical protein
MIHVVDKHDNERTKCGKKVFAKVKLPKNAQVCKHCGKIQEKW